MNRWHSVANSFSLFVFVSDVLSIFVDLLVFTNFFCSVLSCQSPKNHKSLICDRIADALTAIRRGAFCQSRGVFEALVINSCVSNIESQIFDL